MTKQIFILAFFLMATLATLVGCQKEVTNIKLPETNPKLVVGCFISPQDTIIALTLTRSNPVFGSGHNTANNLPVTDASVTISNGTNSVILLYNSVNEQYEVKTSTFPITTAQTYFLTISTPKGETVSASCTVPSSNLTSLMVNFVDTISSQKVLNVKWQDIPNQVNYYRLFGQMIKVHPFAHDTIYKDMFADNSLQNDNEKDGREMSTMMSGGYVVFEYLNKGYDIYLLNIDVEYYKYQHSLDNYSYDNPFSEPSPLYTNIKGGLGIFGAYQKLHVRV